MPVNLPTAVLRSFVAIVDTGSMLNAAEQVFLTQSALSLQIKRLEELLQQALFTREGRRLALTPSGEVLLDYARRVLSLHDEAVAAVSAGGYAGPVRIGMVQDFADTLLTGLLARFAELHPDSQIYARVAGTAELLTMLERGQLDIILGYAASDDPGAIRVSAMRWYGEENLAGLDVVPLAVLEKPCRFRDPQRTVGAMRECAERGLGVLDEDQRLVIDGSRVEQLSGPLRCYTGCATHLAGEVEDGDLVRLDPMRKRLTIFRLADRKASFPAITSSVAVDLRRQDVSLRAEDRILMRKSQVFGLSARSKQRKLEADMADKHGLGPDKIVARTLLVSS